MITLYNTLTRRKEEFRPMEKNKVRMYVCGPTVYDVPHIGHGRSAYIFDVIRRYFEYAGFDVCFVRNVTDIDDKIIRKATEELQSLGEDVSSDRLKERTAEVAMRYLDAYRREMGSLGVRPPTIEPKATENISQMIEFIETLIDKGYGYVRGKNVYFSVEKFDAYGKLSNQDKGQMMHGVRIEPDKKKRHPLDFALWKEAKPYEPCWRSPWGEGRPGWHIECSVMSTRILGAQFDIHGGGLDLIFPHHENEIAQAEAATDKPFANYWIHNGLLSVGGEKMSKSLGNYVTIADFMKKYGDPDLLKIAFLKSHYRSPMDYSDEKIADAGRSRERIMIFSDKVDRMPRESSSGAGVPAEAREAMDRAREKFEKAMDDDFNTPLALSVIFEAVKTGNDYLSDGSIPPAGKARMAGAVRNYVWKFANVLGLSLSPVRVEGEQAREIERLIGMREDARAKKDYAAADGIRKELMARGVVVEDTPEGPVWRKS